MANNSYLDIIKMNWNNIRGHVGERIIDGLLQCSSIREVHLNNNLLGVAYDDKQPPICKMADLLTTSKTLEYLDLSFNFIEQKSIFCISHGLKFTSSLKNIIVEGNPIGPVGLRFLIQAMNLNNLGTFNINMKEIEVDKDIKKN
jgi:Ran GTPase-activating protein (RanGAP) involved in mRNA processing and transport